ncbi:Amidase [Oceanicola granulosus HTCC2516]|uniref:Amidase n=1 Tax=Oceanicola granulosus (strain ATCC BAA-861 / DSM 15982 / KCTC 12143 / HTCC2516) TaxID=314256 RepID=Q2CAK0_OCEGH|nr:amidase family protein [Oceanicola granulosus]EAR49713.1 Amidase [Oceanicola granulosus HTCC2516]
MDEWLWMSAAELGRRIGSGEIDPVALTRAYLDAIAAHPDRDRIYARVTEARALAEAEAAAARARSGLRRSPLDGVPVSWKDMIDSAGVATEAGTALMRGRVPARDATVLANATGAGLVCLGKTHLSEIAFSGLGLNPVTATPPNVHDPGAVAGGSSSGAAASVAHGLAAAAVGSDTGGSVRIPAAWNDLTGLKTTHGLLPLTGTVPLCGRFDTIGPLTRSVEDAALMLAVLGDHKEADLDDVGLAGRRFLVLETVLMEGLEETPRAAFASALERLEAAGAVIERAPWAPLEEAYALSGPLFTGEAWSFWGELVAERGEEMFPAIRERVSAGRDVAAADFLLGWERLEALRRAYATFTAPYDAVLSPTAALMPPQVERLLSDPDHYRDANLLTLRNTRLANLMGTCALTLPTGTPGTGLMLTAAARGEGALLRIGRAAERALA